MAGGKETPRQKMIGMMYLVLTALLALNVSKQIIAAFVTLNDKLDASAEVLNQQSEDTYGEFDKKEAALKMMEADLTEYNFWDNRSAQLKSRTGRMISFLLGECNEMIKASEGEDWIAKKDSFGNIVKLKPLIKITSMDNYDIPTNFFVGGNPEKPNERGLALRDSVHAFRNEICSLMGTYKKRNNAYSFKAPEDQDGLHEALTSANPKDTAKLAQFYKLLTIPEQLMSHDHGAGKQAWSSVTFDHAPIVAAAAMFTSLKLDIKNAESLAAEYMLGKVNAPIFDFNKIEPMTLASRNYINQGDSMDLRVMIAAYDSNDVARIQYGMDADTIQNNWQETTGSIVLDSRTPGQHKVKGAIGVRERGSLSWKPWEFSYTVGQPTGIVALPKMRILYWGYDNEVEGTASGFPPDKVSLSGNGVRLNRTGNGKFIAKVDRGTRTASINVTGRNDDGTTVNLGSYSFECKPLPPAKLFFGRAEDGGEIRLRAARDARVRMDLDESVPLTGVNYTILNGELTVSGVPGVGGINRDGSLDRNAKRLVRQAINKKITISVKYRDQGDTKRIGSMTCKVM